MEYGTGGVSLQTLIHNFWPEAKAMLHSILIRNPGEIPEPQNKASGEDLYFEVLELQPIKLSISFMRTERISGEDKYVISTCTRITQMLRTENV